LSDHAYHLVVHPPKDAIETTQGTIWLRDGILIERTKDVLSTVETVAETFDVFHDLGGGSPRPFLFDVRVWQGGKPAAWRLAIKNIESTFIAVALLIDPESPSIAGPYPEAVGRLLIPVEFFTDEEEALAFLRGFLIPASKQTTSSD
jgi:hypothetical protein